MPHFPKPAGIRRGGCRGMPAIRLPAQLPDRDIRGLDAKPERVVERPVEQSQGRAIELLDDGPYLLVRSLALGHLLRIRGHEGGFLTRRAGRTDARNPRDLPLEAVQGGRPAEAGRWVPPGWRPPYR